MSKTNENSFVKLSKVEIKGKIEKKGNFDYLSWATAWTLLQVEYPGSQRKIYKRHFENGDILNYFDDGKTCWVSVGIVVNGVEHIDELPITDFRNTPIRVEKVTSFDVNTTIQRATAKAIAMHGLGLQLWVGEDIVNVTSPAPKLPEKEKIVLEINTPNWERVLSYIAKNKADGLEKIVKALEQKYQIKAQVKKAISNVLKDE